ncbi:hypothetical protein FACS18942_04840 [Planctomycetales bacterium]|nr:hypothetical protein FACS18942_04840 [Planctomycetales bacterium]GHT34958.1 hypothetical protein FACS189427_03260 [Planctomycetales bacterium]
MRASILDSPPVTAENLPQQNTVIVSAAVPVLNVDVLYQSALTKHQQGNLDSAELEYRSILRLQPEHSGALHFLGMVLFVRRLFNESLVFLEKALKHCPDKAVYHNNYGVVLKELHRLDEAASAFQKAASLNPSYADARSNLGFVCLLKNDLKRAEYELESALTLKPNHPDAQKHFCELKFRQGNYFASQERFDIALRAFQQAASLPGGQKLWYWRYLNFCPSVFFDEESIIHYWGYLNRELDRASEHLPSIHNETLPRDGFTPSFNLPHLNKCCREVKEKFARLFEKTFNYERSKPNKNHKKIRVGFVVTEGHHRGFLRVHRHLLEHLDVKKFDIFFICPNSIIDSCRQSVQNEAINYVGFSNRFDLAVKTLFEIQCDVLYHWKVGGGTLDYFLAMVKAASVQCTSLGTHGTSGVSAVDYYISTSQLEIPNSAEQYTEQLILFDSYPTSHPFEQPVPTASRSELGLPADGAVYFCPHRLPKYHPCFDRYFQMILEGDRAGHIFLCTGKKKHLAERLKERLQRSLGTALMPRIHFLPALPLDIYKKYLSAATCILDSPVYAGDLTTHDALCQGTPTITQEGKFLVQRYTAGLYRRMGLEQLIGTDAEDYSRIAVRLGTEPDYREEISRSILKRSRLVFEPANTVRDYEAFFERVCSE